MADQELYSFTRDDVVHAFRSWEIERRLHPGDFLPLAQDLALDVEVAAESSAAKFLELLPVTVTFADGMTSGEILRTIIDEAEGRSETQARTDAGPVTVESAARKAADALEAGNVEVAAGWTNLVRALS